MFKKDLKDLNVLVADEYPLVTEFIDEIIQMTEILVDKGYAYVEKDGSVYYKVSKFKDYGKLSGIKPEEGKPGTRVDIDQYEKEEAMDFALWKGHKEGEPFWESPWGKGRPGWHIECSVMSKKYLGVTFDIHAGGLDLRFPHHENEIAQSEAANEKEFVKYWFHGGMLDVEGRKMSKSLGNYVELDEIEKRGIDLMALRYLMLTTHYRGRLNFTWKSLEAAQSGLNHLRTEVAKYSNTKGKSARKRPGLYDTFVTAISDDLNLPEALKVTWEVVKSDLEDGEKLGLLLKFDEVLGLDLKTQKPKTKIPEKIKRLVKEREGARREGKWKEADKFRKEIESFGYKVKDTEDGPRVESND